MVLHYFNLFYTILHDVSSCFLDGDAQSQGAAWLPKRENRPRALFHRHSLKMSWVILVLFIIEHLESQTLFSKPTSILMKSYEILLLQYYHQNIVAHACCYKITI